MARSTTALSALALVIGPASAFLFPRQNASTNFAPSTIALTNVGNQMYTAGVQMGTGSAAQHFGFVLSTTTGYTIVAGTGCNACSTNSSAARYNPSESTTFQAAPGVGAGGNTVSTTVNGKTVTGAFGTEDCALQRTNGTYWNYPNQSIIVASDSGTETSAVPQSGIAGLGQSGVPNATDTLIGQYLAGHPTLSQFQFGLALNGESGSSGSSSSSQSGQDSSGGTMDIFQPNPSSYTGSIGTVNVASNSQQSNFGTLPPQLGSYDWTVQMQGWQFSAGSQNGQDVSGGQGTYVTVEVSYPYMLLGQSDAQKIYAAIPGSQPYTLAANAVTTSGVPVLNDPNALSWSIPCSASGLSLTVSFAGITIPIQPSDLFTSINGVCVGNVKGWTDPTRTTYIFGSTFLRGAYVLFTANPNGQQNTIGFANRLFETKSSKSSTGAIVGGVIGGLIFIALVLLGTWLFLRHRRNREVPPSAMFASSGNLNNQSNPSTEKHLSLFGFSLGSKDKNHEHLVAEPWQAPPTNPSEHGDRGVTVQPWTPAAPQEQSFLSPMGTNFSGEGTGSQPQTATSRYSYGNNALTPPPPQSATTASSGGMMRGPTPPGTPGFDQYDRPANAGHYSPLPNPPSSGPAMWVERS